MEIKIDSIERIHEAAHQFIGEMGGNRIFAFYGKTDVINSPTFAIVNEYMDGNGRPVYHFDFYRIRKPAEVLDIGFEDYIDSDALCFMEWPELIGDYLPEETVKVYVEEEDDGSRTVHY